MNKSILALLLGTVVSSPVHANIKDSNNLYAFFNTDYQTFLKTGGGASDYRKYVSLEYANIVSGGLSGTIDIEEIEPIYKALMSGNGKGDTHGLDGVILNFVTPKSFSISYPGRNSTTETVVFMGYKVESIIAGSAYSNVDIKDKNSKFAIFDTDNKSNISIGGGKNDAIKYVSTEFAELTGGSKIDRDKQGKKEVELIFNNLVNDKKGGWNGEKGIENVEITGLTENGYSASFKSNQGATEHILFTGTYAKTGISNSSFSNVDTKDPNNRFAIVNDKKVSLGGSVESVSPEFKDLVGNSIHPEEAEKVLAALTEDNADGIGGVRLIGLTPESFAIELDSSGPGKEFILFTGPEAKVAYQKVIEPKL